MGQRHDERHEGGCLCGAIRFRATGAPIKTNLCFCTQCRRQTGSAMPAFATWPAAAVTLLSGTPAGYRASDQATRQFCRDCGSALFWRADAGTALDVFLGALDAPERIRRPDRQIWTRHRLPWVDSLAGVPDYADGSS